MELGSISTAASKLLAALEKSGISDSAHMRSSLGPGGSPDPELVRTFERAMARGPEGVAGQSGEAHHARPDLQQQESVSRTHDFMHTDQDTWKSSVGQTHETGQPGHKPDVEAPSATSAPDVGQKQKIQPSEHGTIHELHHILERMNTGHLQPDDLFRMQYLIGILKVQTEGGLNASQKTAQGFETLLKQQG
ncbi:hypothetical protein MASR1M90_07890 [Desulfovibrionales bacterium]